MKRSTITDHERWEKESKARHAEYDRMAAIMEKQQESDMDRRCPESEGWVKTGNPGVRIKVLPRDIPPMLGEGI